MRIVKDYLWLIAACLFLWMGVVGLYAIYSTGMPSSPAIGVFAGVFCFFKFVRNRTVLHSLNQAIEIAVDIFRRYPQLDDESAAARLVAGGVQTRIAARLVEFVPSAYCRATLQGTGIQFCDLYERGVPGGVRKQKSLSSEPVWTAAFEYASTELRRGIAREDMVAVAGRSAEFEAANQLLQQGSRPEDLHLTALRLPWPEDGLSSS